MSYIHICTCINIYEYINIGQAVNTGLDGVRAWITTLVLYYSRAMIDPKMPIGMYTFLIVHSCIYINI
jgi:hypothetical protein